MEPQLEFLEYCLPVIGRCGEKIAVCGTGVKIAPKLVLTAFHSAEGLRKIVNPESKTLEADFGLISTGDLKILLHQPATNAPDGEFIWTVRAIYRSNFVTDLALLFVELAALVEGNWQSNHMGINLGLPAVREEVAAFGFPDAKIIESDNVYNLKSSATFTHGPVTALCEARLSGLRTFPSFEIETIWPGGMSGGPIFQNGGIVGLVTTAFAYTPSDENMKPLPTPEWPYPDEQPVGVGAMLWPIFGDQISIPFVNNDHLFSFRDLVNKERGYEDYWVDDVSQPGEKIYRHHDGDKVRIGNPHDKGERYRTARRFKPQPSFDDILHGR